MLPSVANTRSNESHDHAEYVQLAASCRAIN